MAYYGEKSDIILAVATVIVLGFIGLGIWNDKKNPKTYREPERIRDTVTVYGKSPSGYRKPASIDVMNKKGERFAIDGYYTIKKSTDGRRSFSVTHHLNREVELAERGDTLVVESRDDKTYEVLKNLTANRLMNSGR